jgi:hypothetical protein
MDIAIPSILCVLLTGGILYMEDQKRKGQNIKTQDNQDNQDNQGIQKENFNSLIMARPDYKPTLAPRFDPFASAGVIRGSAPPINQTAVQFHPLTPDRNPYQKPEGLVMKMTPEAQQVATVASDVPVSSSLPLIENKITENKNDRRFENENFSEKIKISSRINNKMSRYVLEPIDEPETNIQSNDFSELANLQKKEVKSTTRPDLSYEGASLPKLGIDNKFKDPTDPSNYMYDRTLFAPLKRRNGGGGTDFIRGDVYVAPNRFGWFDVPSNPGTDLNAGFFNLNYPSFEQHVENQDLEVKRQNSSLTLSELESIQRNNPFSTNNLHRP